MTDLLSLLSGIHRAVTERGCIHLSLTDVEGLAGAVDRRADTIHISPGLTLPEMLHVLADGVAALAPDTSAVGTGQVAVGGGSSDAPMPQRHLHAVPDE